jgi:hypothetical protein
MIAILLTIISALSVAAGMSVKGHGSCSGHFYNLSAQCPSCFPVCTGQSLTSIPTCPNQSFAGSWFEVVEATSARAHDYVFGHRDLQFNLFTTIPSGVFLGLPHLSKL